MLSKSLIIKSNGWDIEDVSIPIFEDQIMVKIKIAGICRTDIQAMKKLYELPNNRIIGHEAAGIISFIPDKLRSIANNKNLKEGDRVAFFPFIPCKKCINCINNLGYEYCINTKTVGIDVDGAFSEYINLPIDVLVKADNRLSWKELAYAEPVSAAMSIIDLSHLMLNNVAIIGNGRIAELTLIVVNYIRNKNNLPDAFILDPNLDLNKNTNLINSFDTVIETWPNENSMKVAANILKYQGKLILKSRPSNTIMWPHKEITLKRIEIIGSPYGSFKDGLKLMANKDLNVSSMLGKAYDFTVEDINRALYDEENSKEKSGKLFILID